MREMQILGGVASLPSSHVVWVTLQRMLAKPVQKKEPKTCKPDTFRPGGR